MKLRRFLHLLDLEGPAIERWPADTQGPAKTLLATSPEAQRNHAEAVRLDALMRRARPGEVQAGVSDDSVARVMAAVAGIPERARASQKARKDAEWLRLWPLLRPRLTLLVAGAAVGVAVGVILEGSTGTASQGIGSLVFGSGLNSYFGF